MHAAAAAKHRKVTIDILFAEDLDRILRERRPEYFSVIAAKSPLRGEDVARYSAWQASQMLSRLGRDSAPQIQFPVQDTATFLDGFISASRPPHHIDTTRIDEILREVEERARGLPLGDHPLESLAAKAQGLNDIVSHVTSKPVVLAKDAAPHIHTLQNGIESTLNDAISILRGPSADPSGNPDENAGGWVAVDAVKRYARSLLALLEDVETIRCEIDAALARRLLITGRWGTGKSFQLATLTRRAQAAGVPVLLLRGRDFTRPDAPILSQPWRNGFDNENAEAAVIAAMLDAIGHHSDQPLFLIIDGLNESSLRDLPAALRRLHEMIARFPNLRLILSSRRDRMEMDDDSLPELVHESPDRVTMARSVERALQAPPGTRWHAALTNPLLASVAVLVLSARPYASDRLLNRTTLFDAWVEVLADEASAALDLRQATIRRVIDALAETGGERKVIDLASETRLHSDRVDSIVQRLADDGLLESGSSAQDTARFRWEAMNDMLQMRHAIRAGRLDRYLSAGDEDRRLALSSLAAELVPKESPTQELPDLKLSSISVEECDLVFALSLGSRGDDEVRPRTLQVAKRLFYSGGEVSENIVRSVISMPHRKKLGIAWLNAQLRTSPLHKRTRCWPQALESLSEDSQFDQRNLESLLSWYATDHWAGLSDEDAESAVELLAWMGCTVRGTGLPEFAVCSLVEILHRHPEKLEVVVGRLKHVDDDHPRDALFTAAAGVVARWPRSTAAEIMRDTCSRALDRFPRPQSYRSLAAIHTAIGSRQPMHRFLNQALPPLTAKRPLRLRSIVDDEDRGMFADGRGDHEAKVFESRILSSLNIARRHHRLLFEGDRADSRYGHLSSLVFGRWLARQYSQHRTGSRLFSLHEGTIKAGTPENPAGDRLEHPEDAWDFFVDPTIPLDLALRAADTVHSDTWWAIRTVPATDSAIELRVTAPDGVTWIVIDGRFRLLAPGPAAPTRPTLRLGRSRWALQDEDDGRPVPGRTRHEVIRIDDATLTPRISAPSEQESRLRRRTRFADSFVLPSADGELVSSDLAGEVNRPSADALELLNATWTGEGLNCVDPAGNLVITDPAVGLGAPHALLMREDALVAALGRTGQRLTIHLTIVNNRLRSVHNSETHTVVLGGS